MSGSGHGFVCAGHARVAHVRACYVLLSLDTIEGQVNHRGELCVVLHESHDLVVRQLDELANDLWCELSANHLLDWVAQQAAELAFVFLGDADGVWTLGHGIANGLQACGKCLWV